MVLHEVGRALKICVVVKATALELEMEGRVVSAASFLSPHSNLSPHPSTPYPCHGGVPHLGEVFLGTIVFLDGRHYQERQEVLSLGGADQCLGLGREGTAHLQGFSRSFPLASSPLLTMVVYTKATTAAAISAMKMMRRIKKN